MSAQLYEIVLGSYLAMTVYFLVRHGWRWALLYAVAAGVYLVLLFTRHYLASGFAFAFSTTCLLLRSNRDRPPPPQAPDSGDRGRPG